jgi:hypothetical protein
MSMDMHFDDPRYSEIHDGMLPSLPRVPVKIDGKSATMICFHDPDPEAELWEPICEKMAEIVEETIALVPGSEELDPEVMMLLSITDPYYEENSHKGYFALIRELYLDVHSMTTSFKQSWDAFRFETYMNEFMQTLEDYEEYMSDENTTVTIPEDLKEKLITSVSRVIPLEEELKKVHEIYRRPENKKIREQRFIERSKRLRAELQEYYAAIARKEEELKLAEEEDTAEEEEEEEDFPDDLDLTQTVIIRRE